MGCSAYLTINLRRGTGTDTLPEVPDWDEHTRLSFEKEILGFFITGHPLEKYVSKLKDFRALTVEEICAMKQSTGRDESISTGGVITSHKIAKSKKGDLYAQGSLEDMTGKLDFLLFSDNFKRLQERLKLEVPVLVRASVRVEEGEIPGQVDGQRHHSARRSEAKVAGLAATEDSVGIDDERGYRRATRDSGGAQGRGSVFIWSVLETSWW